MNVFRRGTTRNSYTNDRIKLRQAMYVFRRQILQNKIFVLSSCSHFDGNKAVITVACIIRTVSVKRAVLYRHIMRITQSVQ